MTLSQTVLWKRVAWKFFIFLFWVAQKKMLSYGVVILGWTIPLNDLNVIWSLRGFYGLVPFSSLCPLTVNQEAYFCNFYHFENWICLILTSTKCHAKCRLFCACKVYLYWPCMCFFLTIGIWTLWEWGSDCYCQTREEDSHHYFQASKTSGMSGKMMINTVILFCFESDSFFLVF